MDLNIGLLKDSHSGLPAGSEDSDMCIEQRRFLEIRSHPQFIAQHMAPCFVTVNCLTLGLPCTQR